GLVELIVAMRVKPAARPAQHVAQQCLGVAGLKPGAGVAENGVDARHGTGRVGGMQGRPSYAGRPALCGQGTEATAASVPARRAYSIGCPMRADLAAAHRPMPSTVCRRSSGPPSMVSMRLAKRCCNASASAVLHIPAA